jgi:hypothetical protein
MAKLTINIADEKFERDINANCDVYDYENKKLPDETKQAFLERIIKEQIRINSRIRREDVARNQITVAE